MTIPKTKVRAHLRRALEGHLTELGYSVERSGPGLNPTPEIVRVSRLRGRIAYGEILLHSDLSNPRCHDRLIRFSRRRTRHRSAILFFIGVAEEDREAVEALLERLEIRSGTRGGHVHVVPSALPNGKPRRKT